MPQWPRDNFLRYNQILRANSEPVQRRRQVHFKGGTVTDDEISSVLTIGGSSQDGPPGDPGARGPTGIMGILGLMGLNGLPGVDGKDGIDGSDGSNGSNGSNGVQGPDGANGSGAFSRMTLFIRSAGSGTYFPPQDIIANNIIMIAVGGGGGGGGEGSGGRQAGGGGGSGGAVIHIRQLTTHSIVWTVGNGGGPGQTGESTIIDDSFNFLTASGGDPGTQGGVGFPDEGIGGAGGLGGQALGTPAPDMLFPGHAGTSGRKGKNTTIGGNGGLPFFGPRYMGEQGDNGRLITASGRGAGGMGGATNDTTPSPGTPGARGVVIIITTGT